MLVQSPIFNKMSGKMGGLVGARNAGGMYVRTNSMPVNPNTPEQQLVRSYLASLVSRWTSVLSKAQREAWSTYGQNVSKKNRIGATINVSGQNWFIGSNSLRLRAGLSIVDDAPTEFSMATFTPPTVSLAKTNGDITVAFTNSDVWAGEVGGALLLFASRPLSQSRNFPATSFMYVGKIAGAVSPPTSPSTFTNPFNIEENYRQWYRLISLRADGRVSSPFRAVADPA